MFGTLITVFWICVLVWVFRKPELLRGGNRGWMWVYLIWAVMGTAMVKDGKTFPLMVGCVWIGLVVLKKKMPLGDFKLWVRWLAAASLFFTIYYLKVKWSK